MIEPNYMRVEELAMTDTMIGEPNPRVTGRVRTVLDESDSHHGIRTLQPMWVQRLHRGCEQQAEVYVWASTIGSRLDFLGAGSRDVVTDFLKRDNRNERDLVLPHLDLRPNGARSGEQSPLCEKSGHDTPLDCAARREGAGGRACPPPANPASQIWLR